MATTSSAQINGSISGAFRPAYDLLVRPPSAVTPFERRYGLVRDNFLSNLFGGISRRQLAAIRRIPGIQAAPIENVGYVLASQTVLIPFHPPRSGPAHQLFRLSARFVFPGGSQSFGSAYVYVSRSDRFTSSGTGTVFEHLGRGSKPVRVCGSQSQPVSQQSAPASPFTAGPLDGYITCFSEVTPAAGSFPNGRVTVPVSFDFPMLLTAINPRLEASWFGLAHAVTSGHYLRQGARARLIQDPNYGAAEVIPVLASSTTYVDEQLALSTSLVATGNGPRLARELAAPSAARFVSHLQARPFSRLVEEGSKLYKAFISSAARSGATSTYLPVSQYWVAGQPHFSSIGHDAVKVSGVDNPPAVWKATPGWGGTPTFPGGQITYVAAPPANSTRGYDKLAVRDLHPGKTQSGTADGPPVAMLDVVGEFNPARLPGFSPASRVPLETFYPPVARAANRQTARAIGGPALRPTTDLSGYIAQPPSLLTTTRAAAALYGASRYVGSDAKRPISAVLVRLTGRLGTGPVSRARIEAAAVAIRSATGLAVEITDGSSPTPVGVTLQPLSRHEPVLKLREGWTKTGVSYKVIGLLDGKTVGLVVLAGLFGLLFVAGSAAATVRARRRELAVLVALGWTRRDLFTAVLGEVLVVSLLGAAAGSLAALLLAHAMSLSLSPLTVVAAVPAVPVAAMVAGLVPAWLGTRYEVVQSLTRVRRRGGRRAGRTGIACATVTSTPGRTCLASGSLALGLTAFSSLLIMQRTFGHQLLASRTVLGTMTDLHVRGLDLAAAAAILVLGVLAVANTTLAGSDDRLRSHSVLASVGWRQRDLLALVLAEASGIAGLGIAFGIGATAAISALLGSPLVYSIEATVLAAAGSIGLVLVIVALPTRWRLRGELSQLLGGARS
ncbi:MAG: ABC transporter permease [Acidimicrobiales bacterium]